MLRLACITGFLAAGYFRIPEVLIEWLLVMWLILSPYFTMELQDPKEPQSSNALLKRLLTFLQTKAAALKNLLHSETPEKPILQLVLTAIIFGWVLVLGRLFFYDWPYVVAYEVLESLFDIVIFVPAFFMIRQFFIDQYGRVERRHEEENRREGELREWEDKELAKPDGDEDEPSTVTGTWMPQWGSEPRGYLTSRYLMYPMDERAAFGIPSIDEVREEMDWKAEQAYAEELAEAKSKRRLFTLIGIIPFAVGWGLSFWWFVDLLKLISRLICGSP